MGSIIYFSHGGGPLPILGDPSHNSMINFMKNISTKIKKPESVIVISAHWEESVPTIIGNDNTSLFYDYYGFPKEAYDIKYPVSGNLELINKIEKLFNKKEMKLKIDNERGFDHGLFIPMMMMYPEADIPMVQISLIKGLDPKVHIEIGKVLSNLREENILIIGSGFSFHNMKAFDWNGINKKDVKNDEFQNWIIDICTSDYPVEQREKYLIEWEDAPNARYCHPREEHLLPLHVCCGVAGNKGSTIFNDYILGKRAIAIEWEI
jgi:4,5-DOPA dioxygenase extradiol